MARSTLPVALICALALLLVLLASAAGASPVCTPASRNSSAALAGGMLTVSPAPGTRDASHLTQISFLGVPRADIAAVMVSGSRSGSHDGLLAPYSQGDGASFLPSKPFSQGEKVTVHGLVRRGASSVPFSWSFTVARADSVSRSLETPPPPPRPSPADRLRFFSQPGLRPPTVQVNVDTGAQTPGYLFLAPYAGSGQYGPMILDSYGRLVWFKDLPAGARAANLRVQEDEGKPVLTWWQDPLPYGGRSDAGIVIADSSYRTIAVVRAGNGYKADLHAFHLLPGGRALMTVYDAIRCDLKPYGGPADGALADTVVQEIDLRTSLVRYEWHSLDRVAPTDSYMPVGKRGGSPKHPWDWFHINAISPQPNGRMLVNSRNTWTVYEVDQHSGRVLWQLGGKHSSFSMASGIDTAWQHDADWQQDGTITFFDNGASPRAHPQSRGLVVRLDLRHMHATFVQSFVHSPPIVSESQGDLQLLGGGDWFIGWGQEPDFTEFAPDGKMLFDAHLPAGFQSYTVLKYAWTGQPSEAPRIALRPDGHGGVRAYASWNGATDVVRWRVLGGSSPSRLTPLASAQRSGFETVIDVPHATAYLTAQALDASDAVLASSATVSRSAPPASP